ncbi:hypothetical protein GCM10007160_16780 [Litchfieldella qijiaojingensis]|uniref:Helix-turn-helix domain-containing protein n=1 Tax=Litchfieldella qijiaojingensis TaxID=980347 RepID=A0ABQ2YR74_9GAMM|nr:helix-turn-helix domain-containing protein [Halomonas qijiaojingensis]GGX89991.1 hypothetical protein GCM10007160_16780 [Halomonas qijiaojingensis]
MTYDADSRERVGPVVIPEAAHALGVSESTLRRWIAAGAPVARRGGRGRGNVTLVDPDAVIAWLNECDATEAMRAFAGQVPELVAGAIWESFRLAEGPHKRGVAELLVTLWYLASTEIMEAAGADAPEAWPEAIERLRKIAGK